VLLFSLIINFLFIRFKCSPIKEAACTRPHFITERLPEEFLLANFPEDSDITRLLMMREELQPSRNSRFTIHLSPLYEAACAKLFGSHGQSLPTPPPTYPHQVSDEPAVPGPSQTEAVVPPGSPPFFYNLPTVASEADLGTLFLDDDPLYVDSDSEKDDHETLEAEALTMYPILVIAWTEVSIFLFNSHCLSNFISTERPKIH
jgi:hypothetical protein